VPCAPAKATGQAVLPTIAVTAEAPPAPRIPVPNDTRYAWSVLDPRLIGIGVQPLAEHVAIEGINVWLPSACPITTWAAAELIEETFPVASVIRNSRTTDSPRGG
jgi:hypothetical protein